MEPAVGLYTEGRTTKEVLTILDTKDRLVMLLSIKQPNMNVDHMLIYLNFILNWFEKNPTLNKCFFFCFIWWLTTFQSILWILEPPKSRRSITKNNKSEFIFKWKGEHPIRPVPKDWQTFSCGFLKYRIRSDVDDGCRSEFIHIVHTYFFIFGWFWRNLAILCRPSLKATSIAVLPSLSLALKSMVCLPWWSSNNLTTSFCPLVQEWLMNKCIIYIVITRVQWIFTTPRDLKKPL